MSDRPPLRATIGLPPTETLAAFDRRDGDPLVGIDWRETWQDEHARAFTVAKIARLDILNDVRASLRKIIAEGGTFETWKKDIQPTLQQKGWWGDVTDEMITGTSDTVRVGDRRLRTIYRTNLRVSRAAGQWQRIQAAKRRRPYLRYVAVGGESGGDGRNRPHHLRLHGIILPVDHPFWTIYYPPNDWLCRCTVQQLSERDLKREGWSVTTDAELAQKIPQQDRRTYRLVRDQETGALERQDVPQAPLTGAGWSYNPGQASISGIGVKATASLERAIELGNRAAAQTTVRELVASDDFAAILDQFGRLDAAGNAMPRSLAELTSFPIAILDAQSGAALATERAVVRLSADTYLKQLVTRIRQDFGVAAYRSLPDAIENADWILRESSGRIIAVARVEDRLLRSVLKLTQGGDEIYLLSVRWTNVDALRRDLATNEIIRGDPDAV